MSASDDAPLSRELDAFFLRFPHAVIGIDRTLRVAFANPPAEQLFEGGGLRPGGPLPASAVGGAVRELAESLTSTADPLPSTTLLLSDGRVLRASGIAAHDGDPAVLFLEDVTAETRSDRVSRNFVRNAAHQLRTPLTGIASSVQVLQSGAKEDPAERDRFLRHVERHTDRLTRIAHSLLVLARAQDGEPPHRQLVELRPLIDNLAEETEAHIGVELLIDCPCDLTVLCEPDLLQEALSALIDNAVKHTVKGSISLCAREDGQSVTFEVRDTGGGIPAEHRARLFEPFYQADSAAEGFGLGLAIAAQAVAAMDGELRVADTDGGTLFVIRLPSAEAVR